MVSYCTSRRISYNNTFITVYWIRDMKIKLLICIIITGVCFMLLNSQSRAQEPYKIPDDEWPSQVIYDTVHVCYNGIIRWIAMGNPQLMTQQPPPHIARLMLVHCFCVLDQIRTKHKYKAYVDFINNDSMEDQSLLPKLFMRNSLKCVKEYGTLQGLVILDEKALEGLNEWSDNETQSDTEIEGKSSDNNSGKSDSPELPEELPQEDKDLPLLNF